MNDILTWLRSLEIFAEGLYRGASAYFRDDQEFSELLAHLAEEERSHLELLNRLAPLTASGVDFEPGIDVDEASRTRIEALLHRAMARLTAGTVCRDEMVMAMAEAEFSEWNDIFLYVVDAINGYGREFQKAVAAIEHHRNEVERFILRQPNGEGIAAAIGSLRRVWNRRILIVEDELAIGKLLKTMVMDQAEAILAGDGETALELLRTRHFDAVVSDIQMPGLSGIELHQQAAAIDPELPRRFLFYTGSRDPRHREYADATGVPLLTKPAPLSRMRKAIEDLLC